jgi:hypothetical protein
MTKSTTRCGYGIIAAQQLQSLGIENHTTPTPSTQPLRSKDMVPAGGLHILPKPIMPADDDGPNRVSGSNEEMNAEIYREAM